MKFILFLAVICLIAYIFISRQKSRKKQEPRYIPRLSEEISLLIDETMHLSTQNSALPMQIFQLAGKLAPYPNKDEIITAIDFIYNTDIGQFGFGRRVSLTTLRFIGTYPYSTTAQHAVDYLVLRGLDDPAIWVRHDAAWVANSLKIRNTDIIAKLRNMQSAFNILDIETGSPDDQLRRQINDFFADNNNF